MGHSRPLFIYFRLFNTVDNKQMFNKILPMTGVELGTSGIKSDRSTNWATTNSHASKFTGHFWISRFSASYLPNWDNWICKQGHTVSWLDARNLCRERCMDLISIETAEENQMVQDLMIKHDLFEIWTSGRLCNFHGCDQPHLQPRHINGKTRFEKETLLQQMIFFISFV